jgi:DNA-binding beta-propeller fold protein YncE
MKTFLPHFIFLFFFLPQFAFNTSHQINDYRNIKQDDSSFTIQFIKSISNSNDILKDKSISEEIFDWIFGEEVERFVRPMSIVTDETERIFALDQGGGYIVSIDTLEQKFSLILNNDDKIFPSLVSICKFKGNTFLFTDSFQNQVYIFNLNENSVQPLNKKLELNQPTGIAYNSNTNEIWVVETLSHQISVFDSDGKKKRTIGSRGIETGQFNFPTYIWIDKDGMVYVVDSMNFRLQILNSNDEVVSVFGEAGDASGFFARPKGVATDSFGHIYIVDALYNTIQIFDKEGNFLYYFGTKGSSGGEFWLPTGIYIDSENYIYIADSYNSRIQIFKLVADDKN